MPSGSFAPNLGFSYDQVTTPSNPSRGQTWRERNGSGDVLETWYWNGTYWLSTQTHKAAYSTLTVNGSQNPAGLAIPVYVNTFIEKFNVCFEVAGTPVNDANNYYNFFLQRMIGGGQTNMVTLSTQGITYSSYTTSTLANNAVNLYVNSLGTGVSLFCFQSLVGAGNPTGFNRFGAFVEYRHVK